MPPSRSVLELAHLDAAGNTIPNTAISVYETDGTTPVAQSLYTQVSGGSPVVSPQTNSVGERLLYADRPQRVKVAYADAPATLFDDALWPDPADILLDGEDVARTRTGSLTFTDGTLVMDGDGISVTAGGIAVSGGGLTVSGGTASVTSGLSAVRNDASNYAATLRNSNTTNARSFRIRNAEDTADLLAVRRVSGNDVIGIGIDESALPVSSLLVASKTISSGAGYVVSDVGAIITADGGDYGAFRALSRQTSAATTGSGYRAIEAHALRDASAGDGTVGTWGIEVSASSRVAGTYVNSVVGISLFSDNQVWYGGAAAQVRANTGIMIYGGNGWERAIRYYDTDGSTVLFNVDQVGAVLSAGHIPRTTNTYSLGDGTSNWLAVYAGIHAVMSNGSAGAPVVAMGASLTEGLFIAATNAVGVATSATEAFRITSTGLLDWRRAQTVATGGGATATLTNVIGGSGPATAQQAGWLKMQSGGANIFVPYWT